MTRSILLLVLAPALLAQPKNSWDRVKALTPGNEIRVSLFDGRIVNTEFVSAGDDSLLVAKAAVQETLDRPAIQKISLKGHTHHGKNALIGLAIGAGAGLVVGIVVDSRDRCGGQGLCINILPNLGKEAFPPLGGLVGALVGGLSPSSGWREVYRMK